MYIGQGLRIHTFDVDRKIVKSYPRVCWLGNFWHIFVPYYCLPNVSCLTSTADTNSWGLFAVASCTATANTSQRSLMAFSITYPLVWPLKRVVSSIHSCANWSSQKVGGGPHPYEWMNEWKCEDFKCVWKPTESRLCLTFLRSLSQKIMFTGNCVI